ncbi:unnamed protein product [Caenorhabditis auriculariae]|uniref:Uncharacterized protein n=1 Tax=Caenorhabditis auriculariae TaxID=2777116 RepID=A0A8S1H100_9PELO|nr:unnamed protein product [Caenorhabditis auriculariae]
MGYESDCSSACKKSKHCSPWPCQVVPRRPVVFYSSSSFPVLLAPSTKELCAGLAWPRATSKRGKTFGKRCSPDALEESRDPLQKDLNGPELFEFRMCHKYPLH